MTTEMLRTILRLALQTLRAVPAATLSEQVPWLQHRHIAWCLEHVCELTLDQQGVEHLRLIREAMELLRPVDLNQGARALALEQIIVDLHWMARRDGTLWARDGMERNYDGLPGAEAAEGKQP